MTDGLCIQTDRLPLAYIVLDSNHRVLEWNRAAERTFGYLRAEAVGRNCLELIHPAPDNRVLDVLRRVIQGDMHAHSVNRNRTKDGRNIICDWFNTPLMDADGRYAGVVCLAEDVTERKAVEDLLEESRRRFQAVFETALDGMLLMDDAGGYVDANPSICEVLGYSREELRRLTVWDITPPANRARIPESIARFFAEGTMNGEYTVLCRNGTTRVMEFRAVANILPGLHLANFRDVTERKRAEERAEEYSRRVRALSLRLLTVQEEERQRLARELHDEVGQTLTCAKLALDASLSVRSPGGPQPTQARDLIDEALRQVRNLSFDLRPALLDHLGLPAAVRALVDRLASSAGLRVNLHQAGLEQRLPPELETAAYRIVQEALTNVVRHAGTPEAAVRIWRENGVLRIQVEDAGAGFDPVAAESAGRSSGLPGMRERVAFLGGCLRIDAWPGGGTHLSAGLPLPGKTGSEANERLDRPG